MGVRNDIAAYLNHYRYAERYGKEEDVCALLAAQDVYGATGDENAFAFIQKYYDAFLLDNGEIRDGLTENAADWVNGSRCLFLLYDKTGEEKYRLAIEKTMDCLRGMPRCERGNFTYQEECSKEAAVEALYRLMPFYMEYETTYDKKEKYNDIIAQFETAQRMLYEEEKGLCGQTFLSSARYLTALADTMDCMSVEIYEQYRKLQDMFKIILKSVLNVREKADGEEEEALVGYCILKACRMGILLKEKYVDNGMEIVEKLLEKSERAEGETMKSALFMAYVQYMLTERETEA